MLQSTGLQRVRHDLATEQNKSVKKKTKKVKLEHSGNKRYIIHKCLRNINKQYQKIKYTYYSVLTRIQLLFNRLIITIIKEMNYHYRIGMKNY